jgi:hypothetical protein
MQVLTVHVAAKEVDFILSDEQTCLSMVQGGYYSDLKQVLSAQQQVFLSPFYLYAERAALEDERDSQDPEKKTIVLAAAEDLEDPVPVALQLPKTLFEGLYTFSGEGITLVIPQNAPHVDNLVKFLEFLMAR